MNLYTTNSIKELSMSLNRKHFLLLTAGLLGLTGCGTTANYAGTVATSPFQLTSAFVQWIDNPNLPFKIQVVTTSGSPPPITDSHKEAARRRMREVANIFRLHAVEDMNAELNAKKINIGQAQTITLTPVDGLFGGAEVTMMIRVTVFDNATRQSWTGFINTTSGPLVSGPINNPPTREYSQALARATLNTMRTAGMVRF
jgi:hypothetical protein